MAPHSSTFAWKIPWMEESCRLQSMGSLRVGHNWAASLSLFTFMHWRKKWQPTPVFLPGASQGQGSLVVCPLQMGELKQGSDPHIRATVLVRGGTFQAESETADLWQPKWNENQIVLATAIHMTGRNMGLLEGAVTGSWSLGIVEQSQCKDCCWLWRDRSWGDCGGKCLWKKVGQSWKQGDTAELCVGAGAITIASLTPHTSIGSWTIERLAHQMPDAWNYTVGPHPGCPFKCLTCQSTE